MVLNVDGRTVGVVMDAMSDVVQLGADDVAPAPEFTGTVADTHIQGIASLEQAGRQRMLILVQIETLLSGAGVGLVEHALQ